MEKLGVTPLFSGEAELSRQMSPEEFVRIVRGIVCRRERELKKDGKPSEGQTMIEEGDTNGNLGK